MKIFYWLCDTQGVGHYRGILPATALANNGHHVTADIKLPDEAHRGAYDVIIGMRVCNDGATHHWQKLARAGHTKLVFEVDDDLWHVDPSNKPARAFYRGDVLDRLTANATVADVVTVSTEPLAHQLAQFNRNVHVVSNQIPAALLDHRRPTTDLLTVGWRGGSSHARDFGELAAPLRRWLQHPRQRGRVGFHAMGVDYTPRVTTPRSSGAVRYTPWKTSVSDFLHAVDFDAAVIPLRPNVFNESKSELALLEMAALGIPCIASPVGPYKRAVGEGAPVVLADSPRDWEDALASLLGPDEGAARRADLAAAGRAWAAGRTVEGNINNWIEAYQA